MLRRTRVRPDFLLSFYRSVIFNRRDGETQRDRTALRLCASAVYCILFSHIPNAQGCDATEDS